LDLENMVEEIMSSIICINKKLITNIVDKKDSGSVLKTLLVAAHAKWAQKKTLWLWTTH